MIEIRRVFTHVEHIHHEFGPPPEHPLVRGAIGAVLTNPFAGRYEPDILPMMALLDPVGGDIALHLAPGHSVRVGLFADLARFDPRDAGCIKTDGQFDIVSSLPVRGVATSGRRGRSFSLGIADSVTVLAATAAQADAAATVIANAVDVQDAGIHRRPASERKDDSDLGNIPVTVDVETLAPEQVGQALEAGVACALALQKVGLIWSAVLVCQGQHRPVEPLYSSAVAPLPVMPQSVPRAHGAIKQGCAEESVGSVFA